MLAQTPLHETATYIGWTVLYCVIGAATGIVLVLAASLLLPRLINRMTPSVDEEKEILRGNTAVGEYFGRVAAASIIGISIVVAAAILGGILAGLHE